MTLTTQQEFDLQDILVSQNIEGLLDIMDEVEKFIDIRNKTNKEDITRLTEENMAKKTLSMSDEFVTEVETYAKKTGRTFSGLVKVAVEEFIGEEK